MGHLACMLDHRIPKSTLFGWVPQPRPCCGTRKRWRVVIRKDIKDIGMNESKWYTEATGSREGWRTMCSLEIGGIPKPKHCRETMPRRWNVMYAVGSLEETQIPG